MLASIQESKCIFRIHSISTACLGFVAFEKMSSNTGQELISFVEKERKILERPTHAQKKNKMTGRSEKCGFFDIEFRLEKEDRACIT
jgi:hypothetical protein